MEICYTPNQLLKQHSLHSSNSENLALICVTITSHNLYKQRENNEIVFVSVINEKATNEYIKKTLTYVNSNTQCICTFLVLFHSLTVNISSNGFEVLRSFYIAPYRSYFSVYDLPYHQSHGHYFPNILQVLLSVCLMQKNIWRPEQRLRTDNTGEEI